MPRLFEENGFINAQGKVLPLSQFKLFTDLEKVANAIRGAARHLTDKRGPVRVVLCGGLCSGDGIIHRALCEILSGEGFSISVCESPMVQGALRLAGMK